MDASSSRSPSPHTPEPSDDVGPIALHNDGDISTWLNTKTPVNIHSSFAMNVVGNAKPVDDPMLRLDDLLVHHVFEDSPTASFSSLPVYDAATSPHSVHVHSAAAVLVSPTNGFPDVRAKPITPAHPQDHPKSRVLSPPKESCFNLPIMIPSIPEGGTKSRVETQVRVTVELADFSASSNPRSYNRIGSWKWLKLPPGTATKRRTRKQGKIDPEQADILYLTSTVTCASPPHNRVLSCSSCQAREAKRVAKKLAARVRPARSDSDSPPDPANPSATKHKQREDTTSIIQFNCAEVLDFSTGSVVLPLRITCYCRHHREKVGFLVHFTMMDHAGRIVGTGTTRPIMITDDHKTTLHNGGGKSTTDGLSPGQLPDPDWLQGTQAITGDLLPHVDGRAHSRRSKDLTTTSSAKRAKPYDSRGKRNKLLRGTSESSVPSPTNSVSTLPMTRSPTPPPRDQPGASHSSLLDLPPLQHSSQESESSSDTMVTPDDQSMDFQMLAAVTQAFQQQSQVNVNSISPPTNGIASPQHHIAHPHSLPLMFFDTTSPSLTLPLPVIHRLIPNCGPTHGGVEVTVLGANFHPTMQLNCVFGDVAASSTQRWSDNTLVCILPPRAVPGIVAVWFDGIPKPEDASAPLSLFTYSDDSDRALMELALQVVGLKMTGKIEDAKNVAMRIVGNAGSDPSPPNTSTMMHVASLQHDFRSLLLAQASESEHFEALIIDFLLVLDTSLEEDTAPDALSTLSVISHKNNSGQTLLHLAAFLGFEELTRFLITRGADLDIRDRNGCTPLHLATVRSAQSCARLLVQAGADIQIVDASAKTAMELSKDNFFDSILPAPVDVEEISSGPESSGYRTDGDDGESQWGDVEEDSDVDNLPPSRPSPRQSRRRKSSAPHLDEKPPIPPSNPSVPEEKRDVHIVDKQTASFVEMIQRTFAQFPVAQGLMPNMPNLPGVPWNALPQIPVMMPVFIPLSGWSTFLGGETPTSETSEGEEKKAASATRAALEIRATWEKLISLASAQLPQQEELPPPQYTPKAEGSEESTVVASPLESSEAESSSMAQSRGSLDESSEVRPLNRRAEYAPTAVPDEDINSYGYRPTTKQTQKIQKKHDRMLFSFWLPVLFFGIIYLLYIMLQFAYRFVKATLPLRSGHLISS